MSPGFLPSLFTLIGVATVMIILAPNKTAFGQREFAACGEAYGCGDIQNISYPFAGAANRPDYCGYPGFSLSCESNTLLYHYQEISYRVLGINYTAQTVTVARNDLWDTLCPQTGYFNTSFDFNLFNYINGGGDQNATLFYGCGQVVQVTAPNQFSCTLNGSTTNSYFVTTGTNLVGVDNGLCSVNIFVPVNQSSAGTLQTSPSEDELRAALRGGFGLRWTAQNTLCDGCVQSGGRCGSNMSSSSPTFACYCADRTYPTRCNDLSGNEGRSIGRKIGIGIGVAITSVVVVIIVLVCCCYFRKESFRRLGGIFQRRTVDDRDVETFIMEYGLSVPKRYKYSDIKRMTNSFHDKLGQGGFGSVFKGRLSGDRIVAVKVLNPSKGNSKEFINEVASIGRTSHVNIVTLLGFCYEGRRRALVYEYMSNGSLDNFIYGNDRVNESHHLGVDRLYEVAIGIARGLQYLHRGCNTRILHLDIKPQNILLDEDFCPKIADFGLAKLYSRKESIISSLEARGTIGYIAPEVFNRNFGAVSHKSDVYSYGMMVIEMVGGRNDARVGLSAHSSEIYFPHSIYKRLELEENFQLQGLASPEENELARKMIIVGLWCIQTNPLQRPSIDEVIEMFEGNIESLKVPPKPFFQYSPPRSPTTTSPNISQTIVDNMSI